MKITILTPSYNRKGTLLRLYNSILAQKGISFSDFEWVIIDDGSSDGTGDFVKNNFSTSLFDVVYYYQSNSGKPSAINHGVAKARGDYIFIVDSDDVITPRAIEIIVSSIHAELQNKDDEISGFCFRKASLDGVILGRELKDRTSFLMNATDCGNLFRADLAYVFKRRVMLDNLFPVFDKEKFVPELFVWNKITDYALVRVFPEQVIYLCEYLPDGLSYNFKKQLMSNPKGFYVYYKDQIKRECSLLDKVKKTIRLIQCCIYMGLYRGK